MRCNCVKCDYNKDNFCKSPDYVGISEKGECTQMFIVGKTVMDRFNFLRKNMDEAYKIFNNDPTQVNSDNYSTAVGEFQDFCVEVVEELIRQRPDIVNGAIVEN